MLVIFVNGIVTNNEQKTQTGDRLQVTSHSSQVQIHSYTLRLTYPQSKEKAEHVHV